MLEGTGMSTDAELEVLRARIRGIAATLPDVIWSVEIPSHKVMYVSPAAAAVFGKSVEQMSRDFSEWRESIHPEDRDRVLAAWEATTQGRPFEIEYRVATPDGAVRILESRGRAAYGASGRVVRIDGMARDITDRRTQERRIVQLNRMHAVLHEINSVTVRVRDRGALMREACRIAVEQGGFGLVWIGLVDRRTRNVNAVAHHGFGPDLPGDFEFSVDDTDPRSQWSHAIGVIRGKTPHIDNDMDPALPRNAMRKLALERGYRSVLALPLISEDESAGIIVMYAKEPGFFNTEELGLLTDLATEISFALAYIGGAERLRFLSNYDQLTGLPNRSLFQDRLAQQLLGTNPVAVAVANIKRFRLINDSFGREAGDALLRELAQRFRSQWSEPNDLARISGDEFALILPGVQDPVGMAAQFERCRDGTLREPFAVCGREIKIAMTMGVAVSPPDERDAATLVRNAEAAQKKAEFSGESLLFYQPYMNARVAETLLLENKLRRAIDQEQFVLHYQPKIATGTGHVIGLEALIRWNDPDSGLVPPSKFIPILEETGMILEVGAWSIRKALAESRNWRLTHGGPLRIAVNMSPIQLKQRNVVDTVRQALDGLGIAAGQLDLEITESLIMDNVEENVKKLAEIRLMGVNISVDDFGTGYSSLAYLAKLPVNALKIDRSFIATMTRDAQSMTLVSTIISLAHALDLKVIAEGVETEDQAKFLYLLKCDEMQGFLFGRPLPAEEVQDFLRGSQIRTASKRP
jgi:diguanylate cyclase (GGDEF)-like protein/PAS domain S-box-containing protein